MIKIYFEIDLQFFAGEKTEKATPRRRREARRKGQVIRSNEVVTVLLLTFILLVLKFWLLFLQDFRSFFVYVLTYAGLELTLTDVLMLLIDSLLILVKMLAPILLIALVMGYTANVVQIGFLVTAEPLKMDFTRLNPVKGLQRIFSKRALAELVKTVFKTCLVGFIAFYFLFQQLPRLSTLMYFPVEFSLQTIGEITFTAGWRILIVLAFIAAADYGYQVYEYEKSLKMSKEEIKEELKLKREILI